MSRKAKEAKYFKLGPIYYRFSPRLTLITIVALCILTYLCIWQLGRAVEKKALTQQVEQKSKSAPLRLADMQKPQLKSHRFYPVLLQGTYLNNFTFLLDNQVMHHKAGYRVITAFQSPFLDKWVLIDRGWVARDANRSILPNIQDVYGVQILQGIINTIPTGIVLKSDTYDPNAGWPLVIQNLDYTFIAQHLQHPVYEFVVQLKSAESPGAYLIPPLDFGIPSDKHLGYALQWFTFAVLVLIYYILHSFKRTRE